MMKSSQELKDYVRGVHGGQSFDEIFGNIEHTQDQLTNRVVEGCVELAFKESFLKGQFNEKSVVKNIIEQSKDSYEVVEKCNGFMNDVSVDLQIKTKGPKSEERAIQKSRGKKLSVEQLSDLARIIVVGDLGYIDKFRDIVANNSESSYGETWKMRPSGFFVSKIWLGINGVASEVMLGEEGQLFGAYPLSHDVYEAVRNCKDYKLTGQSSTLDKAIDAYDSLKADFSYIASQSGGDDKVILDFVKERNIDYKFIDVNKNNGSQKVDDLLDNLNNLHQIMHLAYMDNAHEDWKKLYVREAQKLNEKSGEQVIKKKYFPSMVK